MPAHRHLPVLPPAPELDPAAQPRTRADCLPGGRNAARPCRWLTCRHSLAADGSTGESCVLDVADQGGVTLVEVGDLLGVTRERARQIEAQALRKLAARPHKVYARLRAYAAPE